MAKDVIKLRVLRGTHPGLLGQALNPMTSILMRVRQGEICQTHRVSTYRRGRGSMALATEFAVMRPQAKGCREPAEAARTMNIFSQAHLERARPS